MKRIHHFISLWRRSVLGSLAQVASAREKKNEARLYLREAMELAFESGAHEGGKHRDNANSRAAERVRPRLASKSPDDNPVR